VVMVVLSKLTNPIFKVQGSITVVDYNVGTISHNSNNEDSDENEIVHTNKNYGNRIVGPWVFGLCWKRPDLLLERRFFYRRKTGLKNSFTNY